MHKKMNSESQETSKISTSFRSTSLNSFKSPLSMLKLHYLAYKFYRENISCEGLKFVQDKG